MQVTQTEAIKRFLTAKALPDLAELYNPNMEVQIIVDEKNGTRTDGEFKGKQFQAYTDGINSWKPIRIPYKANSEPEYTDRPMSFPLETYALGIGMTGWDWFNKRSRWVAFDFDAITDHSVTHNKKLSQEELQKIINLVQETPWVTVRKSTGGNGLHLYVFLDVETNNHTEHAALARSVLDVLSSICNYNFSARVDTCGGNMWVWHQKWEKTNKIGLKLIKKGILFDKVQPDWKQHVPIVSGKKIQTIPLDYLDDPDRMKLFDQLTGQKVRISLDKDHQKLVNFLRDNNHYCSWDSDRWMLTTHTYNLYQAHLQLGLRGKFSTIAQGSEAGDKNCFACPIPKGGWIVRRFTPGTTETDTWEQDSRRWTFCYLNVNLNLHSASKLHGGMEDEKGKYNFNTTEAGIKAAKDLGVIIDLPGKFDDRKIILKENQGKLVVEIDRNKENDKDLEGWIAKPKTWLRVYKILNETSSESEVQAYDDIIRHLVSEDNTDLGWVVSTENKWNREPFLHIKTALEGHYNYTDKRSKAILGSNIIKPWIIVNIPFGAEYPGGRAWNRDGARLRYAPTMDQDSLHYPTWMALLKHCGRCLDNAVAGSVWGKENGLKTGADYLMCWVASMIKQPFVPLPYLFFFGEQDTGKSSFHEALFKLFDRGYIRAESALKMNNAFNAEIKDAVLCVVEEINFRKDNTAANRIKDWVTAIQLPIHEKHKTPYLVRNTTHWIQTANEQEYCPIFPGDTRITAIRVNSLENLIPKDEFMRQLEKEAPDFLATIKNLELPKMTGRLGIPIIVTEDKLNIESSNKDSFQLFLEEQCFYVPGKAVLYKDLFQKFKEYLPAHEVPLWTINRIGTKLPPKFPRGRLRGSDANWRVGNVDFAQEENPGTTKYIRNPDTEYLELVHVDKKV